jgi:hypothetical protein
MLVMLSSDLCRWRQIGMANIVMRKLLAQHKSSLCEKKSRIATRT